MRTLQIGSDKNGLWLGAGSRFYRFSAAAPTGEANVRPEINRDFKTKELDPNRYDRRFTGESCEVFRYRNEIVKALGLSPERGSPTSAPVPAYL